MTIKRFVISYGHSYVMHNGLIERIRESRSTPMHFAMESEANHYIIKHFEKDPRDLEDFNVELLDFNVDLLDFNVKSLNNTI